ncbi:ADP-heptose:LPS heptosyltransferase [Mariniflexile fucanivorans]|uniref:ADP-heptose:LPS heptosyltransferase n=1 Tax=Mariniflexile fucanivorans TaxID=264023 RepID=A0A4R1RH36_9FLAO|nr:glycosyltransferase family 9 protein [Mariniflexile fucanivorans]TCL64912.1 ADP-heptose:LPS heptosyltransferase [Mariniflexile fucanivorans]
MGFKKSINQVRRQLMHKITKSVGNSHSEPKIIPGQKIDIKKVLIIRPNHRLGNQLLLTPLVQEVIDTFPNCEIDLFVKGGVAFPVFENYKQVKKIIQLPKKPFSNLFKYAGGWISIKSKSYDLVINGDKNSSSGRLLTQISNATFKVFGDVNEDIKKQYADYKHISKSPIYNLRHYLTKLGLPENLGAVPVLDIKLSDSELAKGKAILDAIIKNDKKTICIYTNATGNKCYSETWWETFYARLLKEYPEYNIIEMLPIENISKINFKAPHFYSKDIREMGAIIKNTAIFIAADNGVMHLASASLTPTVGFFSVTQPQKYAPYGNGSIALNTNESTIEDWIHSIDTILTG